MSLQGHPIKVVDFGVNRKRVCDFLFLSPSTVYRLHALHRLLSVPSLRGRLMSTSGRVYGHTTWYTSPVSVVLQLRLVSG